MRYRETGQVHMDFHRTTNATIAYLRKTYGQHFLDDVLRRTAHDVYRSLRESLKEGDPEPLVEHWTYYFDRERGRYRVERTQDAIRLTVNRCPAVAHLEKLGLPIDPAFCRQTIVLNEALAEGTPFVIETDVCGDGRCVQTIRRRRS